MSDRVLVPLPGIGTLELDRAVYEAALRPIETTKPTATMAAPMADLVTAKTIAATLSLPVSCIYEYARAGRIPSVRAGKHVRFDPAAVLRALSATGGLTGGRS